MLKLRLSTSSADILDEHDNIVAMVGVRELEDHSLEIKVEKMEERRVTVIIE